MIDIDHRCISRIKYSRPLATAPLVKLVKMDPTIMKTILQFGLPRQIAGLLPLLYFRAVSDGRAADSVGSPPGFWCKLLKRSVSCDNDWDDSTSIAPSSGIGRYSWNHAIAIFSRAKASFTATERSLRS